MFLKPIIITLATIFVLVAPLPSQNDLLSSISKDKLISDIAQELKKKYVFPEIGNQMADYITARYQAGEYAEFSNPEILSAQLTDDLRSISKDKHIRVVHIGSRKKQQKPPVHSDREKNQGFSKVEILEGNIGLIQLDGFSGNMKKAGKIADTAMAKVCNTDALIFDLRKNGGGSPAMIQHLTSYLFEKKTHINSFYYRSTDKITHSYTSEKIKGNKMEKVPVYILTSDYTFSAGEEFTYNLKHLNRATIIGETTGGGANPGGMVSVGEGFSIFIPEGRAINPITKTNWEGVGVIPHIAVPQEEALDRAIQEIQLNK